MQSSGAVPPCFEKCRCATLFGPGADPRFSRGELRDEEKGQKAGTREGDSVAHLRIDCGRGSQRSFAHGLRPHVDLPVQPRPLSERQISLLAWRPRREIESPPRPVPNKERFLPWLRAAEISLSLCNTRVHSRLAGRAGRGSLCRCEAHIIEVLEIVSSHPNEENDHAEKNRKAELGQRDSARAGGEGFELPGRRSDGPLLFPNLCLFHQHLPMYRHLLHQLCLHGLWMLREPSSSRAPSPE